MGSWSNKPFGNDSALDWFCDLEKSNNPIEFTSSTLSKTLKKNESDSTKEEEAIAAIAIVTSASKEPIVGCNAEVKSWISVTGFSPTSKLKILSLEVLELVLNGSELRELWEESDGVTGWENQLLKLKEELLKDIESSGPNRKVKKKVMPRNLGNLVDYYLETNDQKAKLKIIEKLTAIKDPNSQDKQSDYDLPINIAAKLGINEVIEHLIGNGADPNLYSRYGHKSLHLAATYDHTSTVDLLLKSGADLLVDYPEYDEHGSIVSHQSKCVAMLSVARRGSAQTIELLEGYGASIKERDLNGESLIFRTAESGNTKLLKYLINRGLDVNLVKSRTLTFQGETALHYAVRANKLGSVKVLVESGADINSISYNLHENNPWFETPLDFCDSEKAPELYRYLISKGAKHASELPKPK
ncbi:ankyrin repeat domain-containing protein [Thalassotalea ganghwensis]